MLNIKRENLVDKVLQNYLENGSDKKTLIEIRSKIINALEKGKDKNPYETIYPAVNELIDASLNFLNTKNLKSLKMVDGFSTSIYTPGIIDNDLSILLYGGKTNEGGSDITLNTPFDVASITKFYTLVLKDKLVEFGILDDSLKLNDVLNDFGDMKDFTLDDLSRLCGEIKTKSRIDSAKSKEEAYEILKSAYVYSNDRTTNKYNDLPAILTQEVIVRRYNEIMGTNFTFDELLNNIILQPYGLKNTMFNPSKDITVAGNGNLDNLVHDPKTRILGGITGSAGMFTTSLDQMKFAKALFEGNTENYDPFKYPVNPENIIKYGTITFPNSPQSNKGHFGLYQKNSEYHKSLCPRDYANGSFTAQGYTGSAMIFDPVNKIHNTIFVSAIKDIEEYKSLPDYFEYITNEKANGFMESFHTYQDVVTKNSLIVNAIKKILDKEYVNEDNKVDMKIKIKI
jgi:CubicO group peptidase (beta-lactamase class C family)